MFSNHSNIKSSSSVGIHKRYLLDHIELPSVHPNPLKSIELQQRIYDLVQSRDNISHLFEDIYNSLQTQEQYFFLQYDLEYLFYPYFYYPKV